MTVVRITVIHFGIYMSILGLEVTFEINPVLTYCTWLCHEVPQNKQTSIPLGLK